MKKREETSFMYQKSSKAPANYDGKSIKSHYDVLMFA